MDRLNRGVYGNPGVRRRLDFAKALDSLVHDKRVIVLGSRSVEYKASRYSDRLGGDTRFRSVPLPAPAPQEIIVKMPPQHAPTPATPSPIPTPQAVGSIVEAERLTVLSEPGMAYVWAIIYIPNGGPASELSSLVVTLTVGGKTYNGEARKVDPLDIVCPGGMTTRYVSSDYIYGRMLEPGRVLKGILLARFRGLATNDVDLTSLRIHFAESYGRAYDLPPIVDASKLGCGETTGLGAIIAKPSSP